MNKKNICGILLILVTVLAFVACGENEKKETDIPEVRDQQSDNSDILVGLVTSELGLNDKGFNQNADFGAKRAEKEFGIKYTPIESSDSQEYESNLQSLIERDANLVIGVGNQISDDLREVAKKNVDKKFVLIDHVVDSKNVESIIFKENEGSFLMGVLAGEMSKNNKVGFIGGSDIDLINRYEAGFVAGVISVNDEAGNYLLDRSTVKYVETFSDANAVYEAAKQLYSEGCDIVYHSAGAAGLGLFTAAKEIKNSGQEVWAIGSNLDQSEELPKFEEVILSSMVKRFDNAVYESIKALLAKEFRGGEIVEMGLKEKGVSIAKTTANKVPKEVLDSLNKYEKLIVEGEIVVPQNINDLSVFEIEQTKKP